MHYRCLEDEKLQALCMRGFKWGKIMHVSDRAKLTLTWWLNVVNINKPHVFRIPHISMELSSDASDLGWGIAFDSGERTGFHFANQDMHHPINSKQLLAIYYGIPSFKNKIAGHHLLIRSDSTTAIADMKKMGSMCSPFRDNLVQDIYAVLSEISIHVSLTFICGICNQEADEKSRVFTSETSEWSLPQDIFSNLLELAPNMGIDLFASHLNAKLPHFCSWMPTPGCSHVDAFTYDWNLIVPYCFPPFSLYVKCLDHIRTARVHKAYFIVPWHPTVVWFPLMLSMLVKDSVFLPKNTGKRLFLPFPNTNVTEHALHRHLRLAFILLSGKS